MQAFFHMEYALYTKEDMHYAIYHCSIKIIGRSDGKSAVASSAYRSDEKLTDDRTGLIHDFTKKRGVVFTEVFLPAHAPPEYADRNVLWNAVEEAEKKSNAQLAREIEVALPKELSRECQIEIDNVNNAFS